MHLPHLHLENFKGMLHMAIFFVVLFKIHVIDKKLGMLERKFAHK